MLQTPSFYAHILNGLFLFFALILALNHLTALKQLDIYKKIIILLLFSVVFGIHSISHVGLEAVYNYNPLA
jgi:hypothetical protein